MGRAAPLNLAAVTCGKYENEVLPAAATSPTADTINTVMWLFRPPHAVSCFTDPERASAWARERVGERAREASLTPQAAP